MNFGIQSLLGGEVNIPWFVSRGYLVFTPDIYPTIGKVGQSVCNSVVSAAQYLSKMTWVDSTKMAIGGQSYGGYETNFLITQCDLFAAAVSSAGISDFTSHYCGIQPWGLHGESGQRMYESSQMRMGVPLWDNPKAYLENSPIFKTKQRCYPYPFKAQ